MENIELKNLKIKIAQKLIDLNLLPTDQLARIVELEEVEIEQLSNKVYDKAEEEFQEKLQALCLGLSVENLNTKITRKEAAALGKMGGHVDFFDAFQSVIYNILTDNITSRSLIQHILDAPEKLGLGEYPSKLSIYTAIQDLLKDDTSRIELLSPTDSVQPRRGETCADAWIFSLHLPNFLHAPHWSVVPRDGSRVYNYGF